MEIHVVPPERFEATDAALLKRCLAGASRASPSIRWTSLVVDEMGKNISGTGMDTNVIGIGGRVGGKMTMGTPVGLDHRRAGPHTRDARQRQRHRPGGPHDPAPGGFHRLQIHLHQRPDDSPLGRPGGCRVILDTDREAIESAVRRYALADAASLSSGIKDTLHLEELEISEALAVPTPARLGSDDLCGEAREPGTVRRSGTDSAVLAIADRRSRPPQRGGRLRSWRQRYTGEKDAMANEKPVDHLDQRQAVQGRRRLRHLPGPVPQGRVQGRRAADRPRHPSAADRQDHGLHQLRELHDLLPGHGDRRAAGGGAGGRGRRKDSGMNILKPTMTNGEQRR
ncbi:MAG: hypothetical protein M0C28_22995 [Candidatus Moduliflexus flocculans]|nr:hypothetical protein [Candidatus Moduliflexus flocculans]